MDDKIEPIAIIGMATRLAQEADSNENLWRFLLQGRDAMTPFPKDRFNAQGYYHPDPEHAGTFHVKGAHFMRADPTDFDSHFFNLTDSEVMTMDPQQRVLLENVYHALENAGIPLSKVTSSMTAVFTSSFNHDFVRNQSGNADMSLKYMPTGTSDAILSNRVSWFFDFKAPSLTVDTACSGSLVAFHLGCKSLLNHESEMAVVSGVNILLSPEPFIDMSTHGFLSPDGKCFSFDHRASGYSRGEGVGTVIIKRLSDAVRDGDTIRAVVRGTGVNQDGRTPGITLPNGIAQEKLIRDTYVSAGLDIGDTMFVESHGTGTVAGDPIEARAVANAFSLRSKEIPLYVGAMKSAIGHLESTAGVASLIKSVMILESGIIPPNANFEKANPKIPIDKWNLHFPVRPTPWPVGGQRRVSINASGFGGTNAHAILDDAYHYLESRGLKGIQITSPSVPSSGAIHRTLNDLDVIIDKSVHHTSQNGKPENWTAGHEHRVYQNGLHENGAHENGTHENRIHMNGDAVSEVLTPPTIFLWSAFDEEGMPRIAKSYAQYLKTLPQFSSRAESEYMANLAYTLSSKRSRFAWRSFCIASSLKELLETLNYGSSLLKSVRAKGFTKVGFVFTGQGAQWPAMGRELLVYPIFKKSLEDATVYMKSLGSQWLLLNELMQDKASSKIDQPLLAHPASIALQIALVELLVSWGIIPSRVVGHSSGEIAAAYCSGKLGREACWKLAYFRGIVSAQNSGAKGAMIAVGISERELAPYMEKVHAQIHGEMIIACYNSPKNNTVSGDAAKIDALKKLLDADSVFARRLNVSNAFHSGHMKYQSQEYAKLIGDIRTADKLVLPQEVKMLSSVTGELVDGRELEEMEYWISNMVSPVLFTKSLVAACFQSPTNVQKPLRVGASSENVLIDEIVEIGPHSALHSVVKETIEFYGKGSPIGYSAVLNRQNPGVETVLKTAGLLNCKGYSFDICAINAKPSPKDLQMLVKLPSYGFNHSKKVWSESRSSRNSRLREHPRHDLLGARVTNWDAEEPRWRNVIRVSENPWLQDHIVTGICIYPGVGYLVMAIEAAKHISDPKLHITGYRLRDIAIRTALRVPDTKEGVEVILTMAQKDDSTAENLMTWRKFRISSYDSIGDAWLEHCTGYIALEYDINTGPIDNGHEAEAETDAWKTALLVAPNSCQSPVNMKATYETWHKVGLTLGPFFNNLSDVKLKKGHGEVKGLVTVPDVATAMPKNYMHPCVIHPCTLDSMLQLFLASIPDCAGVTALETAILPTSIREVWISAATSSSVGHTFRGYGKSKIVAAQKYESNIMFWDGEVDEGRVLMTGLKGVPISNTVAAELQVRKLCHNIEWKPDLELFKSASIPNVTLSTNEVILGRKELIENLQLCSILLITDALQELKDLPVKEYEGHYHTYYQWMLLQSSLLNSDSLAHVPLARWKAYVEDKTLKDQLYHETAERSPEGSLCIRMGSNIGRFLRREVDPLQLLFGGDNLVPRIYDRMAGMGDLDILTRAYLEILGHSRVDLNILEVGAGSGSSTAAVVETLSPRSATDRTTTKSSMIARYMFTDKSGRFFEEARNKFKDWANILEFKTLDIEDDVVKQGFEQGQYDVIVAGNVLYATSDLKKTLTNLRYLLKPEGKLIVQEIIRQDLLSEGIGFGQLAEWWSSIEPIRKWGPRINEDEWNKILRDAGFSGTDISLKDAQNPEVHTTSAIIASVASKDASQSQLPDKTIVITSSPKGSLDGLALALVDKLEKEHHVCACTVVNYCDLKNMNLTGHFCVSLLELERSILMDPSEGEYIIVRQLLTTCKGLLWVTGDFRSNPEFGMVTGLLRAVRWERELESANLTSLAISNPWPAQQVVLQSIVDLFKHQFILTNKDKWNAEYLLQDGIFYTNRLVDSVDTNDYLNSKFLKPAAQTLPLGKTQAQRPLKLSTNAPGMLNELQFVTDPVWYEPLGEHDVEIFIKTVGLNFRDVMIAMGEYNAVAFGNEGAGVVTRIGSAVGKIKVGDRVLYLDGMGRTGTFQTYGRAVEDLVTKIPDEMSFVIAAALPCVYATAIYGLYNIAGLVKGETVLIHSAAGGLGQAAITLANLVGAEVFATVSTHEKKNLIMTEYGVQEDHIFSSRDLSFAKGIMRMTKNCGVDVVLNTLSGEFLRSTWDCIAPFGRFVEVGKRDAENNGKVSLKPFLKNVMMASVELPTMMRYRPRQITGLIEEIVCLYTEGKIKAASPTKVLPYSRLEESFRMLQSGRGMGKTVLVPNDDDVVPIVPEAPVQYRFERNASYVLAGGLGGIGRSIAMWMASRGAKNLIFFSRSGLTRSAAKDTAKELEIHGVNVRAFACDISNKSLLASIIGECKATLPPIKGCIQGAMVLSDAMFENMTYEQFCSATRPKVQGSWNLHTLLPVEMDFFIFLSSINGVASSRGQANYAAGNTYEDALTAYRISQGLPAVSLNLGAVFSMGYIAENRERLGNMNLLAPQVGSVREEDIHNMIEYCLDPTRSKSSSQITSGLTTASEFLAHSMPLPMWIHTPLFTQLASTTSVTSRLAGNESDYAHLASLLETVASLADAAATISHAVRTKLSKLLNINIEDIDPSKSVSSNGVDSLVAIELRVWIAKVVAADVPMLDILGTMPMGDGGLSAKIASLSKLVRSDLREKTKTENRGVQLPSPKRSTLMASTIIRPTIALDPETTELPPPDQAILPFYAPLLHCFRLSPGSDIENVISQLQAGLSYALVELPFWAGRVVIADATSGRIQLEVSTDDGVEFKFRDFTTPETKMLLSTYDELERGHFAFMNLDMSLLSPRDMYAIGSENPCLVVQANHVEGGLLLNCYFHHSASDAVGWSSFLRRWSHHTATVMNGMAAAPSRFPAAALDRSMSFEGVQDLGLEHFPQLKMADSISENMDFELETSAESSKDTDPAKPMITSAYWHISRERLQALTDAAQAATLLDPRVSTNDALCALFWRCVSVARRLQERGFTSSAIQMPFNVRHLLADKFHPDYMGNAVGDVYLSCPTSELCSTTPERLSHTASRIRRAVAGADAEKTLSIWKLMASMPTGRSVTFRSKFTRGPDLSVTSVAYMGWNNFDWGVHLGKADRIRIVFRPYLECIAILPELDDGSQEVFTCFEVDVMDRLRADPALTEFAEFRCY